MIKKIPAVATGLLSVAIIGSAIAHESENPAVKARTSIMQLYAFNLGTLGGMAKGEVEYDAEAATRAANNLVVLTQIDQSAMWPAGSDNASDPSTRALPAIWENFPDVSAKGQAMAEAAVAMQAAAGQDVDALKAAMGDLGGSCSACHKAYRAPKD
ncbi:MULTISPECIES: cytochrome c [unclassified Ruegeria]|uniref:c-type cytochrome n=1 Tax=unclassified Ruegeria TaxID=2625375 RepID=UPI0012689506|nr:MULTISPECIES: cytochrome c [unclassified Ruegeria]QFT75179.1 Cytochrome c-554 precursor [Ruegeria sp. THAF33]